MRQITTPVPETGKPTTFWREAILAILVLVGYMAVHYRHGADTFIRTHDCLDALVPINGAFAKSGLLSAPNNAIFQPMLGGIPRGCMPSELDLPLWSYRFLPTFQAYVCNEFIARIVALLGMALLLRHYVLPQAPGWIVVGAALCFGMLPFYPYGLSIAGQPLLAFAILNIAAGKRRFANLLVCVLFPFVSSLVLIGFAIVPAVAGFALYRWRAARKIDPWLVAALLVLIAGYLAGNYRLFLSWFGGGGYLSNRVDFETTGGSLYSAFVTAGVNFLFGQYHAASNQFPAILAAVFVAFSSYMVRTTPLDNIRWRQGLSGILGESTVSALAYRFVGLLACCAGLSFLVGAFEWQIIARLQSSSPVVMVRSFDFSRVHWLHPLLWYLVFALALEQVRQRMRSGSCLAAALVLSQFVVLARENSREPVPSINPERLTFQQFFSPNLFADIKSYIGLPQETYRIANVGLHPGIAIASGFCTADGYSSDYPLEYKRRFRKVIAAELAKDAGLKAYFDAWGCRCYLFSAELNRDFFCTKKAKQRKIDSLDVDTNELRRLGVSYVFSSVEVRSCGALGWKLDKVFERPDSPWQVYLYSVAQEERPPSGR